ncbi:MAG: hypothetical protein ACRC14_08020 [Paracoccaceae bacterium]
MTPTEQKRSLARLTTLGHLLLDASLATLHGAAEARNASLARLSDLEKPTSPGDLPDLAAMDVSMRYERWADQRRAEINLTLAAQTATWLDARAEAAVAFAKSQALEGLERKLK